MEALRAVSCVRREISRGSARLSGRFAAFLGVLRISKFWAAPDPAAYYLEVISNERDDYCLGSGEAPGRWIGSGAAALGLGGEAEVEGLRSVTEGIGPASGNSLVGWRKVKGFDLTLSVSLLWGVGTTDTAVEVVAAHDAVAAAVEYLEDETCVVRRAAPWRTSRGGGASTPDQPGSRPEPAHASGHSEHEPQPRWPGTALHTLAIYQHAGTAGFVYRAVLRHELGVRPGAGSESGLSSPRPQTVRYSVRADAGVHDLCLTLAQQPPGLQGNLRVPVADMHSDSLDVWEGQRAAVHDHVP